MKRDRFGTSMSVPGDVTSSVPAAVTDISFVTAASVSATGSSAVSIFAGEIDGDSVIGNSSWGCARSDALSELAMLYVLDRLFTNR
jgi:hypothetical protein